MSVGIYKPSTMFFTSPKLYKLESLNILILTCELCRLSTFLGDKRVNLITPIANQSEAVAMYYNDEQ